MIGIKDYMLFEAIEDNLFWKLDKWFDRFPEQKSNFIDIVSQCRINHPNKNIVGFMLQNIGFDISAFVDFVLDNADGKQQIDDCLYIMQKIIDTIIANKTNEYNNERD